MTTVTSWPPSRPTGRSTTAGTPVMEPAERRERSTERTERPERVEAPRRPTFETEDLDIPAFLRRNK